MIQPQIPDIERLRGALLSAVETAPPALLHAFAAVYGAAHAVPDAEEDAHEVPHVTRLEMPAGEALRAELERVEASVAAGGVAPLAEVKAQLYGRPT